MIEFVDSAQWKQMDDTLNTIEGYFKMHYVTKIVHIHSISFIIVCLRVHIEKD